MATGRGTQLTRQIGEHLVAAELGRQGLIATPFAGNVPLFDLLAADESGNCIPIQVKAINGPAWQFDARNFLEIEITNGVQRKTGPKFLANPDLICVFVLLRGAGRDEFFVFRLRDLQDYCFHHYKDGRRPKNPDSTHCAVWPKDLQAFKAAEGEWPLIREALASQGRSLTLAAADAQKAARR